MTGWHWVTYTGLSPRGERHAGSLAAFVAALTTRHHIRAKLSSPGFSPTRYLDQYTAPASESHGAFVVTAPLAWRCNEGVASLSALVLDLDHATPDWPRLQRSGNLLVCYTTPSHGPPDDPRWRIVAPFGAQIDATCWPAVHAAGVERFAPNADPSCKDCSRFYFLNSGPEERDHLAELRVLDGVPWQPIGEMLTLAHADINMSGQSLLAVDPDRVATDEERAMALRLLKATCDRLAGHETGGRQVAAYGHARYVGHLLAAGALDEVTVKRALWAAVAGEHGNGVGLERDQETRRALRRGLAKGVADGAYDFDAEVGDFDAEDDDEDDGLMPVEQRQGRADS
jgi:hypothetical protein